MSEPFSGSAATLIRNIERFGIDAAEKCTYCKQLGLKVVLTLGWPLVIKFALLAVIGMSLELALRFYFP